MNNHEEDRKPEEKLFGITGRIRAMGGHQINFEKLLKQLQWDEALIWAFCEDCGVYAELNREIAERYAYSAYTDLPKNPEKYYFHTKGCALCDSQDAEVKLVPLPNA